MLPESGNEQDSWNQIVQRLTKRIPDINPAWTDYNLHDPGVTILELFAWMQQAAEYRIRQIGEAHRKKYVKLLGLELIPRKPGKTMVTVEAADGRYLREGTRFYAEDIVFETKEGQNVTGGIFRQFISRQGDGEVVLSGSWLAEGKGLSLYPFGKEPEEGNSLEIQLERELAAQGIHRMTVAFLDTCPVKMRPVEEGAFDGHDFYPLAQIRIEYLGEDGWQEVKHLRDDTYGLMQDGSLCFTLPAPMKPGDGRLRIWLERCGYLLPPCITRISFAMAEVWQQETVEELPAFRGNGRPGQKFDFEETDIVSVCIETEDGPGGKEGLKTRWNQVEDFDNSGSKDHHYMLERGILRFGDGFHGMMPEGRILVSHMVRTWGDMGNIKAGAIRRMEGEEGLAVTNEWAVAGGTREENIQEALERFGKERDKPKRAVTFEDYERLVMEIPGLPMEACRAFGGEAGTRKVILAVRPYAGDACGMLNEAYKKNLYRYLEEKRMVGTRLEILSPEYYEVGIACVVSAKVQYRQAGAMVEEAVRGWIRKKSFGEGISYSQLTGIIEAQPCVQGIISLWLDVGSRGRRDQAGNLELPPGGLLKLKSLSCQVVAVGEERGSL